MNRLIGPLSAALLLAGLAVAQAQSAFPAPLPNQAAAPAAASPFPPVNGAPSAVIGGAPSSVFPSAGAPAVGGFGGGAPGLGGPGPQAGPPPGGEECMKGFVPLREDAEKRGNLIKAASARRAQPDEACKLIGNFAQAELKMIKYVEINSRKCGIPASVSDQLKAGHKNTAKMQAQVCNVAQQQQQRGAAGPSLSEVLGSSAALPEATAAKKGGSTFDTLNGNVLAR